MQGRVAARWRAALAGVAAAAVALGAAELAAAPIGPLSAPLLAVGGVVVDNVPEPVKQVGIAVFGVHDKTALITGTAILLLAYAALVGVLALRSWRYGIAGIALFAAVGVVAAVTRHDAGVLAAVPSLAGAVVAVVVLRFLLDRARRGQPGAATEAVAVAVGAVGGRDGSAAVRDSAAAYPHGGDGRRRFLVAVGASVGVAAVAGVGGRWLTSRRAVTAARAAVRLPAPVRAAAPVPADAELGLPQLARYVTPNSDFYRIDTALYAPQVDPASWELRIHGMVDNPITVSFADLLARPQVERYVTLACVSNEVGGDLIGNARWLGVLVKDLLLEARPQAGADQVVSRSADGWTCGTPTAVLLDGRDAMLAVGMNGEPLPVRHGFPVRMVVPGLYGYVSACKWIVELEVTRFADFDAYWVPRGWSRQAPVKTQSRIDTPRAGARVSAGPVTIAGVAWAQHRGVTGVQVQVDDGPWRDATLAGAVSIDTWRQWSLPWTATKGSHTLRVRAVDATGAVQTDKQAPPAPDGASGRHEVSVQVG
jgi:DMSO/TMAO reductase YedYZ molybdopterin-dependent catalytic subunit